MNETVTRDVDHNDNNDTTTTTTSNSPILQDVNSPIIQEPSLQQEQEEPLLQENRSSHVNESDIPTTTTTTMAASVSSQTPNDSDPIIPERKRSQFSYNSNELRRRHGGKAVVAGEGRTTAVTNNNSNDNDNDNNNNEDESSSGTTTEEASSSHNHNQHSNGNSGFYECNICFDTATHPVLTLCGHLFCWSCIAQWLNAQSRNPTCPVCKAGCGKDKVIPVYGRGREEKDPRTDPSIPTRPAGQRPPPLRDPNQPGTSFFGQPFRGTMYNAGSNVAISAGIGLFPLGITLNIPATTNGLHGQNAQSSFLSRLILMVIILFLAAIIFY
ncbi:hypothetical protein INT45_000654 [Circinella minor]|uniref:RING-type E3 ubiquitin transferase n=1 Tax=Circinella minor TaxID=1195481 RepID=A0A8H7S0I4_9FUNG|nr:hypothetical protein INT45_000654 [Circinella minor]